MREFGSTRGVEEADGWTRIVPDGHGDWINQRDTSFDAFMKIGDNTRNADPALFATYSMGVLSGRDPWAFNSSREALEANTRKLINSYSSSLSVADRTNASAPEVQRDPRKIAWSRGLKKKAEANRSITFDPLGFRLATYRPFTTRWLYFDPDLNETRLQIPRMLPEADTATPIICVSTTGHRGAFSAVMVNRPPALHTADMAGSQCFPLHYYEPAKADSDTLDFFPSEDGPGLVRRDGITDEGLAHFQGAWPGEAITKEDLFHYVYGLLHAPDYRTRYADNLKKALPRIPAVARVEDYRAFRDAGRTLAGPSCQLRGR